MVVEVFAALAFFAVAALASGLALRWHPLYVALVQALPLCGAAPTFLCRLQRKVGKRKQLQTTRLTHVFSV